MSWKLNQYSSEFKELAIEASFKWGYWAQVLTQLNQTTKK